jgi:type IV pilus assembly protein PilY1
MFRPWSKAAAVIALIGVAWAVVAHAQAVNIIQDSFTGSTPSLTWTSIDGACLTAGSAINSGPTLCSSATAGCAATGSDGIPACKGDSYYSKGILSYGATPTTPAQTQTGLTNNQDSSGNGALRLTNGCFTTSRGKQVCYYQQDGAIFLRDPYPSNQGVQVTFTTYTYGGDNSGGHGADGIAFYILNGSVPANLGAWGGSLGYSCSNSNSPYNGMTGAYLGLGMDEYGNFLNQGDNTHTGINGSANPGEVGIRGYGGVNLAALQKIKASATVSDVQNTCKNGGSYDGHTLPDYAMVPGSYVTGLKIADESASTRASATSGSSATLATPITYTLKITPNGLLSLWYAYNKTNTSGGLGTQLINNLSIANTSLYGPMPSSFRFGFGASTGGSNNVHEITCFQAVPATMAVGAPVAPAVVNAGGLIYTLSSDPNPVAGHVQAYQTVASPTSSASAPLGSASAPAPGWGGAGADAGDATHMSAAVRTTSLYSTAATPTSGSHPQGYGSVVGLSSLDSAAFALTTTSTCVPNTATIVSYTVNPNYTTSGCSYLSGRLSGWMLGGFSSNDSNAYLGPPGNAALLGQPAYSAFVAAQRSRKSLLLFSDNDGFLYAVDAATGMLDWGWMPRPMVPLLQNYSAFQGMDLFDGGFTTTDAVDTNSSPGASNWSTYVVGTVQSGVVPPGTTCSSSSNAYHYSLKLDNTSTTSNPLTQAWGTFVCGGSTPQELAPTIITYGNQQYAIYIVNTGSGSTATSTLYEQNVATGAPASGTAISATLPFVAASGINYVPSTGALWIGDSSGRLWSLAATGVPATDASAAINVATMPGSSPGAVTYVGYDEIGGIPYLWATTASEVASFSLIGGGSSLMWSSAAGSSSSSSVMALQTGAQISASPRVVNGVLVVPIYVPVSGNACGSQGQGYYDLFDLASGSLPKVTITYRGSVVTNGILPLGLGSPYTPNVSVTSTGTIIYPGTGVPGGGNGSSSPSPATISNTVMNKPISWRQY